MSARAAIREADLNRALKAAAKHGFRVLVRGSEIEFLPIGAETPPSSANSTFDTKKALAEWRRSA